MKQATYVKTLDEFSQHNLQKLFKIAPETFTVFGIFDGVYGEKQIETEYIVASASDLGKMISEETRKIGLRGAIWEAAQRLNLTEEVMIFIADSTGDFTIANKLFQFKGTLSIEEAMKEFGYEIVGDETPFSEVMK